MSTIMWICECGEEYETRVPNHQIKDNRGKGVCPLCKTENWMSDNGVTFIIVEDEK